MVGAPRLQAAPACRVTTTPVTSYADMCNRNARQKTPHTPKAILRLPSRRKPLSARSVFGRCIATEYSVLAKLPACQGIPTDDFASHQRCWRFRHTARPPHHRPTRSIQGVALRTRACRLYSLQRRLSRPAGAPCTGFGTCGGRVSASGVCPALRFLNRNPTILSRLRVIVKPFAEVFRNPITSPASRPRCSAALVSGTCLRNPPIMPYAYADVKGLRHSNLPRLRPSPKAP